MRMLGRLEIKGGWDHTAKHIPGVLNTLADGISRWPRVILADKVREFPILTTGRNKRLERGVRGFLMPYYRQRTFSASMTIACGT